MEPTDLEDQAMVAMIGDVVGSRAHPDRHELQDSILTALDRANRYFKPLQSLEPSVGDEFQGAFSDLPSAILASLLIRLDLLSIAEADVRFGLGRGRASVFDENRSPLSQDGTAWWSARSAIERATDMGSNSRTASVRTCFSSWTEQSESDPEAAAIDAFLICRDVAVSNMSSRARRLLLGHMIGLSQGELAEEEGITQSAVSQQLSKSGAAALKVAQVRIQGGEGPWRYFQSSS